MLLGMGPGVTEHYICSVGFVGVFPCQHKNQPPVPCDACDDRVEHWHGALRRGQDSSKGAAAAVLPSPPFNEVVRLGSGFCVLSC